MKPYYSTDLGKLYCCDCLKFMEILPDNHIDLTITSPPYDNLRSYTTGSGDAWCFDVFKPIAKELFRVTKTGGVVVWVVGDATVNGSETGTSFKQALYFKECGFNLHDTMIWKTDKVPMNHNRYEPAFEYMFILSKGKPRIFNPILSECKSEGKKHGSGKHRMGSDTIKEFHKNDPAKSHKIKNNIWFFGTGGGKTTTDKEAFRHPAIFPEKLAADHMISWSNENDLIFDPFTGSGTVAKQAELLNRRWLGCEISGEYCEIAAKRIEETASQARF